MNFHAERLLEFFNHDTTDAAAAELDILDARIKVLETALKNTMLFAEWVECLGRTECEIYKHELKARADLAICRINVALELEADKYDY